MKRWLYLVILVFLGVATLPAETVQEIYARGVRSSLSGDNATAKQCFLQVLALDPHHKAAAANLRRIELSLSVKGDLKSRLEAMIVPKVDFREVSLNTALDYLPKLAMQSSDQKAPFNMVRLFPKSYGDEKLITLQLTNIPMSSVLDYIGQIAGLVLKYEKTAIVFTLPEAVPRQLQ